MKAGLKPIALIVLEHEVLHGAEAMSMQGHACSVASRMEQQAPGVRAACSRRVKASTTVRRKRNIATSTDQVEGSNVVGVVEAAAREGDVQVKAAPWPLAHIGDVPRAWVEAVAPAEEKELQVSHACYNADCAATTFWSRQPLDSHAAGVRFILRSW